MTIHSDDSRPFRNFLTWCWSSFRRLPPVVQACFVTGSLGATLMGVFVGNMGLALMGTAVGISGIAVGAIGGVLAIVLPWMAKHTIASKRSGR